MLEYKGGEGPIIEYQNPERESALGNIAKVTVLDNSFVNYIDHLGTDEFIVNKGARLSYGGESKGPVKDKSLLRYLFKNKHTSPFEQVNISFQIRMPIFIMRQFVRHRTFRLNEASARYGKLDKGFYVPQLWRAQDTKNKQGSIAAPELPHVELTDDLVIHNASCFKLYESYLKRGVAFELARMVLPLNALTEIIVNIDMNNLLKYFMLRDDNHAQIEHVQIAQAMKMIAADRFPWVMEMYDELRAGMPRDVRAELRMLTNDALNIIDNEEEALTADAYTGLTECLNGILAKVA